MSLIYAAGVKATAITNIKAAIDARITDLSDGSKALDAGSLLTWIAEQANLMVTDAEVTDANAARTVINQSTALNTPAVTKFANYIKRSNWEDHPDWPTGSVMTPQEKAALAARLKAQIKNYSDDITRHFADLFVTANLTEGTNNLLSELGITSNLPPAVTRLIDTRFYVATYVNDWDEESAPSPVSDLLEVDQNDNVSVTLAAPPESRNVVGWRLYRSNSGSSSAAFQLVADAGAANSVLDANGLFRYYNIATRTLVDSVKSSELQEVCPTVTWLEPPADLKALVGMPNGIMAGITKNGISFCEPYYPYAWPVEYRISTEHPPVALGVFGQTLVVGTQGTPYYISGADSASMSSQKMNSNQSCVSRQSMVGVDGGVVYASPDGLCLADGNGIRVVTGAHFTREDWQALKPSSIEAAYHEFVYYFKWDTGTATGCYGLHLGTGKLVTLDLVATAMYVDKLTDTLFVANGTNITAMFGGTTRRTGVWRSRINESQAQHGFAWLKVSGALAPVTVRWYGDNALVHTAVVTDAEPVRLPIGRYLDHEIEIESAARWSSVVLAGSTKELKSL